MEIWEISIQHHSRWQQNSSWNINKIQTIRFIHSHLRELQHSVDSQFIVKVHQTHNCIIFQMFNNLYIYTHSYPYNEYIFHSNRLIIILRKEEIRITISHVTDNLPRPDWEEWRKEINQNQTNRGFWRGPVSSSAEQVRGQSRISFQLLIKNTVLLRSCLLMPGTNTQPGVEETNYIYSNYCL